jgi:hypothetical protein
MAKLSKGQGERTVRDISMGFLDECAEILRLVNLKGAGDIENRRVDFLDDLDIFRTELSVHDGVHGYEHSGKGYDKQHYADIKRRFGMKKGSVWERERK